MKFIYNKYNLLIFCFLHCFINVWSQNNDIFRSDTISGGGYDSEHFIQLTNNNIFIGDGADGYDQTNFIQLTNNSIFGSDTISGDGYDSKHFIQLTNNNIFIGDGADGYDQTSFVQLTNNSIFRGGIADGYDLLSFIQATNNNIFGGGIADGYHLEGFVQITNNNSIFGGGIADGYDLTSFIQMTNNRIFGGGIADGYDVQVSLLEVIGAFSIFNPFDISTAEKAEEVTFNTFPTPFTHYLNISLPEEEEGTLRNNTLSLINSKGTTVKSYEFQGNNIRIDASKLPAGVYVLVIQTPEKTFKSQVVKIRSSVSD